jgi:hypothetical protein
LCGSESVTAWLLCGIKGYLLSETKVVGVRSLGKAFFDLLTGSAEGEPANKAETPAARDVPEPVPRETGGSAAAIAYSKAGAVVQRHGRPHLTPPQIKPREMIDGAMTGIPEPVMSDASALAGPGKAAKPKASSSDRDALIRRAIAIHRAKRGLLDSLSDEQRERLAQMALAAFRVKH